MTERAQGALFLRHVSDYQSLFDFCKGKRRRAVWLRCPPEIFADVELNVPVHVRKRAVLPRKRVAIIEQRHIDADGQTQLKLGQCLLKEEKNRQVFSMMSFIARKEMYAFKIVTKSKRDLLLDRARRKLHTEISTHKSLSHLNDHKYHCDF